MSVAEDFGFAQMPDGREIAYRVLDGDGPMIAHAPNGPFPIELIEEDPMYGRFVRTLASSGRLVLYDMLGTGSSDPLDPDVDDFEQRIAACLAVLDAVDAPTSWLIGSNLAAIAETIRAHPGRISGAVLLAQISREQWRRSVALARDRARQAPEELAEMLAPARAGDPAFVDWIGRAQRLGSTKAETSVRLTSNSAAVERFASEAQPILGAPPIMLIRQRETMSNAALKWWNGIFPDAEIVTVDGAGAAEFGLGAGMVAELAAGFITGAPVTIPAQRQLLAVLFTDLVDSTPTATATGDDVWRSTLDRYEAAVQRTVQRHHGTVVKHTGDGALVTFPSGSEAIAAAVELRHATRDVGLEGRTGVHVGEIEQRGDDIGGIAVNLAARVMGAAEPGEILVTSSVEQSTVGGRFRFRSRGTRALKGIDRHWQIFTIEAGR